TLVWFIRWAIHHGPSNALQGLDRGRTFESRDSFHDFPCRLIRTRQFSFLFHSFLVWRICFLKTIVVLLFFYGLFAFITRILGSTLRSFTVAAIVIFRRRKSSSIVFSATIVPAM